MKEFSELYEYLCIIGVCDGVTVVLVSSTDDMSAAPSTATSDDWSARRLAHTCHSSPPSQSPLSQLVVLASKTPYVSRR